MRWSDFQSLKDQYPLHPPIASAIVYQTDTHTIAKYYNESLDKWQTIAKEKKGSDDTSVIQSAINAVSSIGGGVCQLLGSSSGYNISNLTILPYVTLRGVGSGKKATRLNITGTITIQGTGTRGKTGAGRLHNVYIHADDGYTGNAIKLDGSTEIGETPLILDDVTLECESYTGTAILLEADNTITGGASITLNSFGDIYIYRFEYGLVLRCNNDPSPFNSGLGSGIYYLL